MVNEVKSTNQKYPIPPNFHYLGYIPKSTSIRKKLRNKCNLGSREKTWYKMPIKIILEESTQNKNMFLEQNTR